jgi:hypothetical protein
MAFLVVVLAASTVAQSAGPEWVPLQHSAAATRHAVKVEATSASTPSKPKAHPKSKVASHAGADAAAVYYDFKGARLGMSLAEWRALPVPAQSMEGLAGASSMIQVGAVEAHCSGDAGAAAGAMDFRTPAEIKANVLVCRYAYPETIGSDTMWMPASMPIGELHASDVEYKFLDRTLYEISVTGNSGLLMEVMSGLRAKWGEPTSVVNDTTQNKAGATFPHTVQSWANPVALIRVETPFSRIDDLNVSYETATGLARITSIEKVLNPDLDKM